MHVTHTHNPGGTLATQSVAFAMESSSAPSEWNVARSLDAAADLVHVCVL